MDFEFKISRFIDDNLKNNCKISKKEVENLSVFSSLFDTGIEYNDYDKSSKDKTSYKETYIGDYEGLQIGHLFAPNYNPTLDELIDEKNIDEANAQVMRQHIISILNGSYQDDELISLQQNYSVLVSDLEDKLSNDNSVPDNLKNQFFLNLEKLESIDSLQADAIEAKSVVADKKKEIEELQAELERLNLRLSTIPEDEVEAFPKDREMQKHIKWSRNDLKGDIADLEEKIAKEQLLLNDLQEDYNEKQKQADDALKNKSKYEMINKSLVSSITKYCSPEVNSEISEFEEVRKNLDSRKNYILEDASFRLRRFEECSADKDDKIKEEKIENPVKYEDVRNELFKEKLIKWLDKYNSDSVLYDYIDDIIDMAEKYGIEPELLGAIIVKETGWGTSKVCREANNYGGVRYDDDFGTGEKYLAPDGTYYVIYSDPREGIEAVAKTLADYPGNEPGIDAVSIDYINKICDVYAEGSDDWQYDIKEFYCGLRWG